MAITLYHHPFSRASGVVWMLEEVGVQYELRFVDIMKGAHKAAELLVLNPMGKLPTLVDEDVVVTESAAIALYLADRYSYGALAPKVDDPRRGTYLRWSFFAPSVIEPGIAAMAGKWECKESSVGWGNYETMLGTMEHAVTGRDWLLGDTFSMADVVFGGTVRYMLMVKAFEPRPALAAYADLRELVSRTAASRRVRDAA